MPILRKARSRAAHSLTRMGGRLPADTSRLLNGAANFLETGRRLRDRGIAVPPPVGHRFGVFDVAIAASERAQRPVFLEFGVWRGETTRYWADRLKNPNARMFGFDSFEGLPEDWTAVAGRGHFSTEGNTPAIDDPRVEFVRGWFDDTLPGFEAPEHDLLTIDIDGDLYSSAVTVLDWAKSRLGVGDLLYFDEFHDRRNEGRAFHEFLDDTGFEFELLATTPGLTNVLFRRTR